MKIKSPLFEAIRMNKLKSNVFNLSHEKKLSMNMGDLVPVYLQDVVPGDRITVNTEMLMRLAPMLAPIMHRVNVYMHYFYVPMWMVFDEWENFITGGRDGLDQTVFPTLEFKTENRFSALKGSLPDYMGIPITNGVSTLNQNIVVSALPFRAYQKIYNEYYRDQNLTAEIAFSTGSTVGLEHDILCTLRKRAWEKDYFTSALPTPQRGADVTIDADVIYADPSKFTSGVGAVTSNASNQLEVNGGTSSLENIDDVQITVNNLRRAYRLQLWLERNMRGGARYWEVILHRFGVKPDDQRLGRPEFLGGWKSPVVISEVLSAVENTDASLPQGNMAGHGLSVNGSHGFSKRFNDWGYVLGIMSVIPRTCYQQGIERHWLKTDKLDFYQPEFANLGEQEVLNQELYFDFTATKAKADTFGYQSRYAEYKFKNSSVHGDFKNNLSFWHMGRIFSSAPSLNTSFVESDPTHEIFANTNPTDHKLYVQLYHDVKASRPMPVFGEPML